MMIGPQDCGERHGSCTCSSLIGHHETDHACVCGITWPLEVLLNKEVH